MTRSRKVEAAVKEDGAEELLVVGEDYTERPIEEYTNEGSDVFCPFIDNKRLGKLIISRRGNGIIHRSGPTTLSIYSDLTNVKNRSYHWAQIGFKSVQCCRFQRDPVNTNDDVCEKNFRKCQVYREHIQKR